MTSPFPGMDPFLEQPNAWHDFHEQFCVFCRAQITPQLPDEYIAKLDEHVYIHELPSDVRRLIGRGDVTVSRETESPTLSQAGSQLLVGPVIGHVDLEFDLERESFIAIHDRDSQRLVTVIEILSPSNKRPGGDREQFLAKRMELLGSDVHLIEIDLLRGGPRMPVIALPPCDYYVMLSRSDRRPEVELWPLSIRDELPDIPVPLVAPNDDLVLKLGEAFTTAFDSGGYAKYIYRRNPTHPLSPEQGEWAQFLLHKAGLRP